MHVRAIIQAALLAALALCLGQPAGAQVAQFRAIVVTSCGSVTLPLNDPATPYMDRTGVLCTTAGTGGGGGGGASTVTGSMEQDVRSSGTLNATVVGSAIVIPVNGQSTVGMSFTGLAASGATITFEQSNDGGTTYTGVNEVNAGTGVPSATRTTDGQTRVAVQGRTNLRLRVSTAGTGTISVAWNVSVREGLVTLASPLPPGTNAIGTFGLNGPLPAGTNAIGTVTVANPTGAGSVTAPGTAGTVAQAVQGIAGGIPQNGYFGQYNGTLPTLVNGQAAYAALDGNARQIISPSSSLQVSNSVTVIPSSTATATGGISGFSRITSSAATTNATVAKASAGRVYRVFACNTTTTAAFLKFYNLASAPTVGTSTVLFSRPVPPAAAAGGLACASYDVQAFGWAFSAGIAYAATTGGADSDATALAAGQLVQVSVEYQ